MRWKLAIQEYDCEVEHLAGVKNVVVDGFSRLVDQSSALESRAELSVLTRHSRRQLQQEDSTQLNQTNSDSQRDTQQWHPLSDDIYNKISLVHNAWRGHRGINATIQALKDEGLMWRNMKKHVSQFCQQCPTCQKSSVKNVTYNPTPFTTSTDRPHSRLNVDTFIVNTQDEEGNTAVVVIVDTCTRWVELYSMPCLEQEFVARALPQHLGDLDRQKNCLPIKGQSILIKL